MKINPADIDAHVTNPVKLVNDQLWWNVPNLFITDLLEIAGQDNFTASEDTVKMKL